jgi:hypothetical protein
VEAEALDIQDVVAMVGLEEAEEEQYVRHMEEVLQ